MIVNWTTWFTVCTCYFSSSCPCFCGKWHVRKACSCVEWNTCQTRAEPCVVMSTVFISCTMKHELSSLAATPLSVVSFRLTFVQYSQRHWQSFAWFIYFTLAGLHLANVQKQILFPEDCSTAAAIAGLFADKLFCLEAHLLANRPFCLDGVLVSIKNNHDSASLDF